MPQERDASRMLVPVAVACATAAYALFVLGLASRWWFEDDPMQLWQVSQITNPIRILFDPATLRTWGNGHAVVPLQILSLWLDAHLFGNSALAAYLHSSLIAALTAAVMSALLIRLTGKTWLAVAVTAVWLLLPSTIAVLSFISARHYLEGLLVTLVLGLVLRSESPSLVTIAILSVAAMLFKEVYVGLIPALLICVAVSRKQLPLAVLAVGLLGLYAAYRLAMVGPGIHYEMPLMAPSAALRSFFRLPYTMSCSSVGYLIYAAPFLLSLALGRRWHVQRTSITMFAVLVAALLALYPVAFALNATYRDPGTWYRIAFVPNTIVLLWAAIMLAKAEIKWSVPALAAATLAVLPGTVATRSHWQDITATAAVEGRFYIQNPDKLLYSELPAYWYIVGLHHLYAVPNEHYILQHQPDAKRDRAILAKYGTVWVARHGNLVEDDMLRLRR